MCVFERRNIFEELLPVAASASECLKSRILESSPNLSRILAVMKHYKKIYAVKHLLRKVLTLKMYQ